MVLHIDEFSSFNGLKILNFNNHNNGNKQIIKRDYTAWLISQDYNNVVQAN